MAAIPCLKAEVDSARERWGDIPSRQSVDVMTLPHNAAALPRIETRIHGDFVEWLASSRGTLAVTTYNSGKLAFFSAPAGQLNSCILKLARPMGLAFDGSRLAVATREEILVWRARDEDRGTGPEARFEFETVHATGRLDVHDLVFDNHGLRFANTRFNCLARPSDRVNFRRSWQPPFVAKAFRQDCCHLNGVGVRAGRVAVVTAFCLSGVPGGWRSGDRFSSGVVVDVRDNCAAVSGLCMPHSPRWDGRRWWLCNSGEGSLCTFDPGSGACQPVAVLPGFTRGLCFAAGRAVTGLSRIRKRHILDAPPVRQRFPTMRSGLWLVDAEGCRTTGALEFVRGGREVYDVVFLAGHHTAQLGEAVRSHVAPFCCQSDEGRYRPGLKSSSPR